MIRFQNRIYEEYSIDPETGVMTDKDGNVLKPHVSRKHLYVKKFPVHCVQAHTAWGYKRGMVVHHIDHDPLNNALSNLVYMTKSEHITHHKTGAHWTLSEQAKKNIAEGSKRGWQNEEYRKKHTGWHHTEEWKKMIGEKLKGRTYSEESRKKMSQNRKGKSYIPSTEHKAKIGATLKGQVWWVNQHRRADQM